MGIALEALEAMGRNVRNKNAASQSPDPIKPERFVDLSVFYIGVPAFLTAQGNDHPHSRKGLALLRKASAQMDSGFETIVRPLVETQRVPQLKSYFQKAMLGSGMVAATNKAEFLSAFFRKLGSRREVVQDVFPSRSRTPALQLVDVVQQETPAAILHNLSAIAPVSGIQIFHQWIMEAAEILGASLTPTEAVIVDAAAAVNIAQQIREVDASLTTANPMSEEAANLQGEKQKLSRKLEQVVENSTNPSVVLSSAVSEINKNKETGFLTDVGRRLGHTPDQEAAMMVRGKSIIAAGAGSGKCVTGETIVSTPSGPKRIDECTDVSTTLSVDVSQLKTGWREAQWLNMGMSETLEVQTLSGIRLRGTPEHPLLVWGTEGKAIWKTLESLEPGDHVLLLPGFARETGTSAVDPEEAYLYGLLMGDGWVDAKQGRVSWSRGGEYLPPHYYRLMADLFDVTPQAHPKKDTQSVTHEVWSRKLVTLLQEKGLAFSSARDKSIPAYLVSATDAERIRFLQGLFDTDGTATGDRGFEWLSASETLARQVHQMLLGLGVVGRLQPKHVEEYPDHTYWRILISGEQLRFFQEIVGFRYEFKKSADLQALCQKDCNPNVGTYPHVGMLLKEVRETWKSQQRWNGRKQSLLMDERWVQVKHYLLGEREPSREKLQALIQGCESAATATLSNLLQFYPDAVVAVKPFGMQAVYDFTVPETHSFIANGIVSHNTRVLASKVVWHIEQGIAPSQIIATSFSQKSAAELFERIGKYGAPITDDVAKEGYGTTHSVARSIISRFAPSITMRPLIEGGMQSKLIRLAMAQVQMGQTRKGEDPNPEESFFPPVGTAGPGGPAGDVAAETPETPDLGTGYASAIAQALKYHQRLDNQIGPQGWLNFTIRFLNDMYDRDPARLTPAQKASLNKALSRVKSISYRVAGATRGADQNFYYKNPANQWFNLGIKELMDAEGRPMGARRFGTAISQFKANLTTPGKAWSQSGGAGTTPGLFAAVYGAYEWLKNNDSQFGGGSDHDDTLINAVKVLVGNPKALQYALSRWKVVLVDEAQDLNSCQHTLFGLIAGYYDPKTQQPYEDGRVNADTYTFIGDDKQAIYEFRGATPDKFIEMSDLVPGGAGFTTKVLEINFRSGAAIVDAANRLIAHNKKQIPMVCRASERQGMGSINYVDVDTHAAGAAYTAERIQELTSGESPQFKVQDFGVAVRTNAEAFAFGVEMLKRGIPFRSRMSFFGDETTKALVSWMRIADASTLKDINQGVLEAHRTPRFGLDDIFNKQLQAQARGKNYYEYLIGGGWRNIYVGDQGWRNARLVKPYVDALQRVRSLAGTVSPQEILEFILNMEGAPGHGDKPAQSTVTALIERVKGDPDAMDLLVEDAEGGEVTADALRALALAPVAPLQGLLEGYEDIGPAMQYIQKLQAANEKHHKADNPNDSKYAEPAVVIDTVHGWKGLEATNLFVPMAKNVFPHLRSKGSEEDMASERRLAYVAITRGKESVTVIAPAESHTGKPAGPSEFVSEACIPSVTQLAEENPSLAAEMSPPVAEAPVAPATEAPPVKKRRTRKQSSHTEAELDAYLRDDFAFFESQDLEKQWDTVSEEGTNE